MAANLQTATARGPADTVAAAGSTRRMTGRKKPGATLIGYSALLVAIAIGWMLREREWINPESGVGYWLGIVGGSLMLTLLLYPLRKRARWLRWLGPTRHWFRLHMVFGLVGPLLILYHCNFSLGSFNSRVAFYSMLLVAGSGIIGRYFYSRIHRGLYGRRTSLVELQKELAASLESNRGLAMIMPELAKRLAALCSELQGHRITQTLNLGRSLNWGLTHSVQRLRLMLLAHRELKAAANSNPTVARDFARLRRSAFRYIDSFDDLAGRVAQFSLFERLFALWHVLHLPIFLMMIVSALFHVLAVHMY